MAEGHDGWQSRDWLFILGLTLLALGLRLFKLGDWSFWEDEIFSLREISQSTADLLALKGKTRHVLFPLLQKGFLTLFSDLENNREWTYRLLSMIFGVVSVPVLILFGRSLVGRKAALFAGLFLALCPWHIYWSQNCRYYTLTALLSLITCHVFWLSLQSRHRLWLLLFSFIPAILAAFSHPSATFLLGGLALFMLCRLFLAKGAAGRNRRVQGRVFLIVIALGMAFLSSYLMPAVVGYQRAKAPNPLSHLGYTMAYYVGPAMICLALLAWFGLRRHRQETADFIAFQILVPLVGITVMGLFVRVTAQYLFFTLPFYCLLAGWGAAGFNRGRENQEGNFRLLQLAPLCLILVLYIAQDFLYFKKEHGWRPRWREAAELVQDMRTDQDRIAVTNSRPIEYYLNPDLYSGKGGGRVVHDLQSWDIDPKLEMLLDEASPGQTHFVLHLPVLQEKDPDGRNWQRLKRETRLVKILPAWAGPRDLTLYIFSSD